MLSIFKIVNGVIKGCNSLKNKLLYTNEISNGLTMARYTYGGQNENFTKVDLTISFQSLNLTPKSF